MFVDVIVVGVRVRYERLRDRAVSQCLAFLTVLS